MSKTYWESLWASQKTGWDLGEVSPPLKNYIDQLNDPSIQVLIPGCGNGYEAEYLWEKGFKNVFIVEIAQQAIDAFRKRCPSFPIEQLIHGDFFNLKGAYDLILEQTFFCALQPSQRKDYAIKMKSLLKPNGKLVGLMFDRHFVDGPPFGGSVSEYQAIFEPHFDQVEMLPCYNSIEPRQGSEIFVKLHGHES